MELAGGAPGSVLSSFFHLNSTENQRGRLESCCDLPQLTQLKRQDATNQTPDILTQACMWFIEGHPQIPPLPRSIKIPKTLLL